jgi:hypothetical protein
MERPVCRPRRNPVLALFILCLVQFQAGVALAADDAVLRDRVLQAIERGRSYLLNQQAKDGSWGASIGVSNFKNGTTGLAVLALLNSGLKEDDPAVAGGLKYLRSLRDDELETTSHQKPYELSLMLQALAAVKGRSADRGRIARLAEILIAYQKSSGGWRYEPPSGPGDTDWDNSVNQFALLGLREAAMTGYPVDQKVWLKAQELFLRSQLGNVDDPGGAGWTYTGKDNDGVYGSMTVAGIASLIVTSSMLQQDQNVGADGRINCCEPDGDPRVRQALKAGERWMASHFSVNDNPGRSGWFFLYYMYGLERAGRFGGVRFYGEHDWYRAGAVRLVESQNPRSGSWASAGRGESFAVVDTCFALLFLSKGLAPVVVNKIEYGPRDARGRVIGEDWNRHPRDVANLIDSLTTRSGWPQFLNWQTVDLAKAADGEGVSALLQAPVQMISGTKDLESIQGKQVELLREYINQGGFLLAMQNCENTEFDIGIRTLIRRMFPDGEYELRKLPPTHDIYRSEAVFAASPPELWGVDFGCRTAIVYAPSDHACRWHKWTKYDIPTRRPDVKSQIAQSMNLGVNIIAYATNRELVSKLDRPPALATGVDENAPRSAIEVARVRHTGGWDAAPHALRHLQGSLEKLGYLMAPTSPNVPASDPALRQYPLAYMHGRKNFAFNQDERNGLRGYVENGGVLIADACCGSTQFDTSFRDMIAQTFGKPLERIPLEHELYRMENLGHDIRRVSRRIPTVQQSGSLSFEETVGEPVLEGIQINGRYVVIYSKYDISCALEQQNTQTCAGYSRLDAAKIATNMVVYALAQ